MDATVAPTGRQCEISGHGYRAVAVEAGAGLRVLEHLGRALIDPYPEDELPRAGRGQVLAPWPNRIHDGAYRFGGHDLQLALSEPARHNASHGLVRWVSWQLAEHTAELVRWTYRLPAHPGYPWTLELHVAYELTPDGLVVTHSATNTAGSAAPYAAGFHPYLRVGDAGIDGLHLTLPAARHLVVDGQLIPVAEEQVEGTAYDFRAGRILGEQVLDDGFGDLDRSPDGRATVRLVDDTGTGAELWVDAHHDWLQVFSGDPPSAGGRRALAVEPMTAPADAFNSGRGLLRLEPGATFTARWGLRAVKA